MDSNEGGVDVIEIHLASCLEFVDVIQEAECKRSAWLLQRRRKPPHAKKLDARRKLFSGLPTVAVMNANSCDPRNVEESEVHGNGRHCAAFTDMVT